MILTLHLLKNIKNSLKDIIIEQVFIGGYLTNSGLPDTLEDKFHDYGSAINDCGITNQSDILKIMTKKHNERERELNHFLCNVDAETKELHNVNNNIAPVCITSRTIYDDLCKLPHKSFGDIKI